jgi:hypothetical protein
MVAAVVTTYLPTGWVRVVSRWSINGRVLGFSEVCFRLAVQRPPFRKVQSTTAATTMWGLHDSMRQAKSKQVPIAVKWVERE